MPHFDVLLDIHEDIFKAAEQNDEYTVKFLVEEEGISANITDAHSRTPAHVAAMYGNLDIVKYLLDRDSSVFGFSDVYGDTIFIKAIMYGHLAVVKYLVEHYKMNVSDRCSGRRQGGNTAIHFAAKHGHLDILKYFIDERGGDVNVENEFKETPVFSAAEAKFNRMPVIEYLSEEKNADLTRVDAFGKNILYKAVDNDDLGLIKYVLDTRGVQLDPNWGDVRGNTLVHRAVSLNRVAIFNYLVKTKKVDVNSPNGAGDTPLHMAARKNYVKMCESLIEVGNASTKSKDRNGQYPVERATHKRVIEYLEGVSSPLHLAAHKNHVMCDNLIAAGNASTKSKDRYGRYPGEEMTHEKVVEYLEKRSRRSVLQPLTSSILRGKMERTSGDLSTCTRSGDGSRIPLVSINDNFYSQFRSLLSVASMIVRQRNAFPFSKASQIIQSNVNLVAVDAIDDHTRFSKVEVDG